MKTLVQLLVDNGASLNAKNKSGDTPLVVAERTEQFLGKAVTERNSTGGSSAKSAGQWTARIGADHDAFYLILPSDRE